MVTITDTVWVSSAMIDQALIKRLQADVKLANLKLGEANAHRHTAGETLHPDEMPKRFFGDKRFGKINSLPHFCRCNGFKLVSQRAAEVLSQFDLGQGGVFPVEIYQPDKSTVFDLHYHFLNFGAVKRAFVPSQSKDVRKRDFGLTDYSLPILNGDDFVAVNNSAFDGPDLWTDPMLATAFFVSDRLAKALKKEKLTRAFRLFRCKVVEG